MKPLLTLLCFFFSCSSVGIEDGPLSGLTHSTGDAEHVVELGQERVRFNDLGLAAYQVILRNTTAKKLVLEYRARWFDQDGIELTDVTRSWKPLILDGQASRPVHSLSPNAKGVHCELKVRLHQPMSG